MKKSILTYSWQTVMGLMEFPQGNVSLSPMEFPRKRQSLPPMSLRSRGNYFPIPSASTVEL